MILRIFIIVSYTLVLTGGSLLPKSLTLSGPVDPEASSMAQAGPYKVGNELNRAEREKVLSEIRSFLWEKLTHRESAQLRAIFYTIEGEPTSYDFRTESVNGNNWCIRADIVLEHPSQPHRKARKRDVIAHNYCEVFRLDAVSGTRILDSENRDPKTYKLRLLDTSKPGELTL